VISGALGLNQNTEFVLAIDPTQDGLLTTHPAGTVSRMPVLSAVPSSVMSRITVIVSPGIAVSGRVLHTFGSSADAAPAVASRSKSNAIPMILQDLKLK